MTGRGGGNGPGPRDAIPPGARPPANPPDAPAGQPADGGPIRRVIRVVNPLGLHFRVADRFSKLAKQFTCAVIVWNGEARADGTNIWDLIGLLVMPDSEVVLEVDGPDAHKAVDPLTEVLAARESEDYTI